MKNKSNKPNKAGLYIGLGIAISYIIMVIYGGIKRNQSVPIPPLVTPPSPPKSQ